MIDFAVFIKLNYSLSKGMDYAFYIQFSYYDQLKERHLETFIGTKIIYLFILHFVHVHLLEVLVSAH
jgi:hypothetical protein